MQCSCNLSAVQDITFILQFFINYHRKKQFSENFISILKRSECLSTKMFFYLKMTLKKLISNITISNMAGASPRVLTHTKCYVQKIAQIFRLSQYIFIKNYICLSHIIAHTVYSLDLDLHNIKSRNPCGIQRVFIEATKLHNVFYEIAMHKPTCIYIITINSYLIKLNSCIRISKYPLLTFPIPTVTR